MCARKNWVTNEQTKKLVRDLEKILRMYALQKGKNLDSLTYAAFLGNEGYRFTRADSNENEWELLEEVMQESSNKNPSITKGQIAETISLIVNTPPCDCLEHLHA